MVIRYARGYLIWKDIRTLLLENREIKLIASLRNRMIRANEVEKEKMH